MSAVAWPFSVLPGGRTRMLVNILLLLIVAAHQLFALLRWFHSLLWLPLATRWKKRTNFPPPLILATIPPLHPHGRGVFHPFPFLSFQTNDYGSDFDEDGWLGCGGAYWGPLGWGGFLLNHITILYLLPSTYLVPIHLFRSALLLDVVWPAGPWDRHGIDGPLNEQYCFLLSSSAHL